MKKVVGLILALILLLSLSILAAAEEAVPDMFANLVERLKANEPRRLVFTEGTDARILEAAARLKQEAYTVFSAFDGEGSTFTVTL